MKKLIAILFLGILSISVFSQSNEKYVEIMQKTTEELYKAKSISELQDVANTFERISNAEKDQWHPDYYLAFTYIQIAGMTKPGSEVDNVLDKAQEIIKSLNPSQSQSSEFLTLQGFLYMLRIPVDPATRGPQYSGLSFQSLQTALGIDPNNPRAHLVLANMQMGTARFFGQDLEESCETLNKSIELLDSQKRSHPLDPQWGIDWANSLIPQCQ